MADGDQIDSKWIQDRINTARQTINPATGQNFTDNEISKHISQNFPQFAPEAMGLTPPPQAPVAPGLQGPADVKQPSEKEHPAPVEEPSFGQRFVAGVKRGIPALNQPGGGYHPLAAQEQQAANAFAQNKPLFKGYGAEDFYKSPVGQALTGNVAGGLGEASPTIAPLIAGEAFSRTGGRTEPVGPSPAERAGAVVGPKVEGAAPYVGKAAKYGTALGGLYSAFKGGEFPGKALIDMMLAGQGMLPKSPVEKGVEAGTKLAGQSMQAVPRVMGNILPTKQGLLPGEIPRPLPARPQPGPRVTTPAYAVPRGGLPGTAGPGAPPPGNPPPGMPPVVPPQLPPPGAPPAEPPIQVGRPYIPVAGELPAAPIQMPAPETPTGPTGPEGVLPAQYRLVKNPLTGRMQKQYVTSAVPPGERAFQGYGTGYETPQGQAETPPSPQENLVDIPPETQTPATGAGGRGVEGPPPKPAGEEKSPEEKAPEPKPGAKSRGGKRPSSWRGSKAAD